MLDKKDIIYTLDMLCDALKLPNSTVEQPFILSTDFNYIKAFIKILRLDEEYHTIKDDTSLVNMYTIGEVMVRGMQILNDLLTDEIKDTKAYKDYVAENERVEFPIIQPKPVESTQGTIRTPRATRTLNPDKKSTPITHLPPSDDRERDDIIKVTQLKKLVEGDEESSGSEFVDTMLLSDEDSGDRIKPGSHIENPKEIVDDDEKKDDKDVNDKIGEKKDDDKEDDDDDNDGDDHNDQSLIRTRKMSDKTITEELTIFDTPIPDVPSQDPNQPTSSRCIVLPGIMEKVNEALQEIIPKLTTSTTNALMKENLPRIVNDAVKKERESSHAVVPNMVLNVHPATIADPELWNTLKAKYEKSSASTDSYSLEMLKNMPTIWTSKELYGESNSMGKQARGFTTSKERCSSILGPQINLNEPPRYLCNKDLFILKNRNTEEKYVLSLHKIHVTSFPKEDLEEKTDKMDEPSVGLIYLNNKEEKRIVDLEEIPKFCDATMEKVLNEVKLKIFKTEFKTKTLLLGKLDLKIMKAYEMEIMKRLKHRKQMIRWELFANGRPILQSMLRQE
nr:hypothetical protein [Tanacetum cinerariifolium]